MLISSHPVKDEYVRTDIGASKMDALVEYLLPNEGIIRSRIGVEVFLAFVAVADCLREGFSDWPISIEPNVSQQDSDGPQALLYEVCRKPLCEGRFSGTRNPLDYDRVAKLRVSDEIQTENCQAESLPPSDTLFERIQTWPCSPVSSRSFPHGTMPHSVST